jgi:hypothetical protein
MKQIAEKLGVGYVVEGRRAQRRRSHAHRGAARWCGQPRHRCAFDPTAPKRSTIADSYIFSLAAKIARFYAGK